MSFGLFLFVILLSFISQDDSTNKRKWIQDLIMNQRPGIRERAEALHKKINEKLIDKFKGKEQEKNVRINNDLEIPITIYTPIDVKKDKMVIFFHGGGWTVNSRKTHQTIVNMLADATKTIWISVEYRLSPEYKFPIWLDDACEATRQILANKNDYGADETTKIGVAGTNSLVFVIDATKTIWISVEYRLSPEYKFPIWLDDACEATRQILANKNDYGADETTKIGVAGDSAGAVISASICHEIKNLDFQILICGQFDFFHKLPSRTEFNHNIFVITRDVLDWFSSNAFRNDDDKKNSRVSLLDKESFDSLPPCLFIAAELDPVRDDSYNYKELLEKAGVKTKFVLIKGVVHPFFSIPGIFIKSCQEVIETVQEFMENQ
ncbi:unnamed protein product [Rotaria socialis]